ncbi:MAG: hypothetical protein GY765_22285, partial [bacterium]|nr:hypothetical protein [bacterium]
MKIRNKLFLSLILTAGLSASLASFAAIFSISQKYETIAREETLAKRKNAENFFYETEGELGRKALIITETEEIVGHMDNPDELLLNLESKGFLLYNVNTTILDTDKNIVASNNNSSSPPLTREELMQLPFIKENKDPLLRYSGIFKF